MHCGRFTAALLVAAAGPANGAMISFASDTADHAWTYRGIGPTMGSAPPDTLTLQIDDNNGPLPLISVTVRFSAEYTLFYSGSVPLGGGAFSHNYLVTGNFAFTDVASSGTILFAHFDNALLTARGNENSWFTTASLQGDNNGGGRVEFYWQGAALPGYGLVPGVTLLASMAFDITALNSSGVLPYSGESPGRTLDAAHRPAGNWWGESSFSAFAEVPAPSTAALLALFGVTAVRRRR